MSDMVISALIHSLLTSSQTSYRMVHELLVHLYKTKGSKVCRTELSGAIFNTPRAF